LLVVAVYSSLAFSLSYEWALGSTSKVSRIVLTMFSKTQVQTNAGPDHQSASTSMDGSAAAEPAVRIAATASTTSTLTQPRSLVSILGTFARAALTDNRRSMGSQRLMALMQVKMNCHLLDDEEMGSVMQELLALLQISEDVANIYQKLQEIEDEEEVAQRVQHGALQAIDVEDDADEEKAEPQKEQLADLFSL
jgi:hypothetical protein